MPFFEIFSHKKDVTVDRSYYARISKKNGNRKNLKVHFSVPLFEIMHQMASPHGSTSSIFSVSSTVNSDDNVDAIIEAAHAIHMAEASRSVDGYFYVHNVHAFRFMMAEESRRREEEELRHQKKRTTMGARHSMMPHSYRRPRHSTIREVEEPEDVEESIVQESMQESMQVTEQVAEQDNYDDLPDYVDFADADSDSDSDSDSESDSMDAEMCAIDDNIGSNVEVADDDSSSVHGSNASYASSILSDLSDKAIISNEGEYEHFIAQEGAEMARSYSASSTNALSCSSLHTLEFDESYTSCTGLGAFFAVAFERCSVNITSRLVTKKTQAEETPRKG
jgi:hypothetical protein